MPEHTTHCCCDESPVKPNCEITGDNIGQRLQNIANCALTSTVEQNFYDAVVALYAQLVELIECKLHFDLSKLYAILACLAIPILFFGFYPDPLINTIEVSVNDLINMYSTNLINK